MEAVISEVFGIEGVAERILPEDADLAVNPATSGEDEVFDTFVGTLGTYVPSEVFVSATATLAFEVARDASADTALIDSLAGCTPTGPDDAVCMAAFIDALALRLYHRPLTDTERPRLVASSSEFASEGDFYLGVRVVIQSMLTSPAFIYRQEIGEDLGEGFHRLDNYELVSKLSFFLWGMPPTDALLEQASSRRDHR